MGEQFSGINKDTSKVKDLLVRLLARKFENPYIRKSQ